MFLSYIGNYNKNVPKNSFSTIHSSKKLYINKLKIIKVNTGNIFYKEYIKNWLNISFNFGAICSGFKSADTLHGYLYT